MTDAMAGESGRGGVGIRVFIAGGEVVKRTLDQIGDRGKRMWAALATGQQSANPVFRAMSGAVTELKGGVDNLVQSAGGAGRTLAALGPVGVAVAAGLGAALIAVRALRASLSWAADLTDAADRIGVTTEALQEMGFVADEAGVEVETMRRGLERLNGTLGAMKTGLGEGRVKGAFAALGLSREDLAGIKDASELLPVLAERLGRVQDRAQQVQIARRLGIEELLPVLRLGAEGIEALTDEARRLGLVLDAETVRALDEADRKIEIAQQRIDMSMRRAVAGLADDFADLVTVLADVVGWLDKTLERLGRWQRAGEARGSLGPTALGVGAADAFRMGRRGASADEIAFNQNLAGFRVDRDLLGDLAHGRGLYAPPTPGLSPEFQGGGSGAAEREAEQRRQRQARFDDQLRRLELSLFDAMAGELRSAEDRLAFGLQRLDLERAERDLAIQRAQDEYERTNGLRGITAAEAQQLRALEAQLHAANERNLLDREAVAAGRRRLQADQDAQAAALDLLQLDGQMARTSAERHRIEVRILELTRAMERQRLSARLDEDRDLTPEQRAEILGVFDQGSAGRRRLLDQQEEERMRGVFVGYGRDLAQAVRDGRLGAHIAEELQSRLLDMALSGAFDFLRSRAGSGGVLGFVGSLFGGGRAGGGGLRRGYRYEVAEHGRPELAVFGRDGQMFSHGELARMLQDMAGAGDANGARGPLRVVLEVLPRKGATFDAEVRAVATDAAVDVSIRAAARAVDASYQAAPRALTEDEAYRG